MIYLNDTLIYSLHGINVISSEYNYFLTFPITFISTGIIQMDGLFIACTYYVPVELKFLNSDMSITIAFRIFNKIVAIKIPVFNFVRLMFML